MARRFRPSGGEHLCYRSNFGRPPTWTEAPERFLDRLRFMGPRRIKLLFSAESPTGCRRMIMIEAELLRHARMPRNGRWWAYEEMRSGLKPEPGEVRRSQLPSIPN